MNRNANDRESTVTMTSMNVCGVPHCEYLAQFSIVLSLYRDKNLGLLGILS